MVDFYYIYGWLLHLWVILYSIAPTPAFFRLARLALVTDDKSSNFFFFDGDPTASNWLQTSKHVCIFNLNVSVIG